jgi:hypothetical protein
MRSWPKKNSPSTSKVGTPKLPRSMNRFVAVFSARRAPASDAASAGSRQTGDDPSARASDYV